MPLAAPTGSNPAPALPHPFYLFIFTSGFPYMEQLLFQRQNKLMLSPVLAALLEVPTSRVDLELVRLNGCPSALLFLSPLVRGMLGVCALPTNRAICIYTHRGLSETAAPEQCLGLPRVIHCVPWAPWD